jgi:pyruvate kinase
MWELHKAGVNIFRMNFSHGDHSDHIKVINWVRELNDEHGTNICLLQDLQGPKIRTNHIENDSVDIYTGNLIQIEAGNFLGNKDRISTTYKTIARDVVAGDSILIDDGNLELMVKSTDGTAVTAEVIHGGKLKSRKGINLPNTSISEPSLTDKDLKDLDFGLEHNVDWIALSFVRTAEDIHDLRQRINAADRQVKIIAKLEKPEAIDNMDAIIDATDAVMVARGDLGVEIDMATVPMIQKELIEKCNKAAKPVIVATQMLESMITNPRPTRAEANDVAVAVYDGADTVMLSGETAAGDFPTLAVESMSRIIKSVEDKSQDIFYKFQSVDKKKETVLTDSLLYSAVRLAQFSDAKLICGITDSGYTAHQIAKYRPKARIVMFTRNKELLTRLNLMWGVTAFYYDMKGSIDDMIEDVTAILKEKDIAKDGDVIVNTATLPHDSRDHANMVKVSVI